MEYSVVEPHADNRDGGTYDEIKAAARKSGGDPAKEWMTGPMAPGSTIYKIMKEDKSTLLDNTKRAVESGAGKKEMPR